MNNPQIESTEKNLVRAVTRTLEDAHLAICEGRDILRYLAKKKTVNGVQQACVSWAQQADALLTNLGEEIQRLSREPEIREITEFVDPKLAKSAKTLKESV